MSNQYQGSHNAAHASGGNRRSGGRKLNPLPFVLLGLAVIIIVVVLCLNSCGGTDEIIGSWLYGDDTTYAFNSDGSGVLIVPQGSFPYTYKARGDKLKLDFESENLSDSEYEMKITDGEMLLIGGEGTVGGEYQLRKIA